MSSYTKSDHFSPNILRTMHHLFLIRKENSSAKIQKDYRGFHTGKDVLTSTAVSVLDFWPEAYKT